jgi:predicted phage tail protein
LIISIKPHSTLQKFFRGTDLKVDIAAYSDIVYYIDSMHPDFTKYIKIQVDKGLQEVFSFLDKNLREITKDEMYMRRPKEDDVIYIVPTIIGGGGKRGLALVAIALAIITFPLWAPTLGLMAGATAGGFAAGTTGAIASTSILGGLTTVGSLTSQIGLTIAMMGITMLFMPKQRAAETSRDNDMFGSLVNTTNSGTPIPINYGLVRIAGQLVSGYIKTIESDPSTDKPVSSVGL